MLWADDFDLRMRIEVNRLRIIIEVAVGFSGCLNEAFSGVAFVLGTFGAAMPLDMVTCPNLELTVLGANNGHEVLGGLVIDL